MKTLVSRAAAGLLVLAAAPLSTSADELPPEGLKGETLNAALRAQGVTIFAPPDQPVVLINASRVYQGASTNGGRGEEVLVQQGGHPCSYTMEFDQPLSQLAFNRSRLLAGPNGITHPVWTATAQDAAGRTLSSVGEDEIRSMSDLPSRRFVLQGPGIKRVVFWGDDRGFDAFCNVITDTIDYAH
jgi:hypothetical protein